MLLIYYALKMIQNRHAMSKPEGTILVNCHIAFVKWWLSKGIWPIGTSLSIRCKKHDTMQYVIVHVGFLHSAKLNWIDDGNIDIPYFVHTERNEPIQFTTRRNVLQAHVTNCTKFYIAIHINKYQFENYLSLTCCVVMVNTAFNWCWASAW